MESLIAVGNDLRVKNHLLYSKLKTQDLLAESNAKKAYKPRWYLLLAQNPRLSNWTDMEV